MLAAALVSVVLLQASTPNLEDPVEFVTTYALALGQAYEGLQAINQVVARPDATEMELIVARKRGATLYQQAANTMAPFAKSKDELIQTAGAGALSAFIVVADGTRKEAAILIDLVTMTDPNEARMKQLMDESTTIDAKMESAWRALPVVTAATTYALVAEGGTAKKLRITTTDRDAILSALELSLGPDLKDPKKMQAVVVAGRLLREFLIEGGFPYATR